MEKCEVHLPLNYNDGKPIEQEKIERVREELLDAFASFAEPYRRTWRYDGKACTEILRFEVITTGDSVTKHQLKELKARLMGFLPQVDFLITTHAVELI